MTSITLDCQAVLFDLDGVLVDSTSSVLGVLRDWSSSRGVDADALLQASHGRRFVDSLRHVAPHVDATVEAEVLEAMVADAASSVSAMPGALDLLRRLPADGWAVVTSASADVALARMRNAGLPVPATLMAADQVAKGKPEPEGYLSAATALGVEPQVCLVIEDAPVGVEAARRAGMRVVAVSTTHDPAELEARWVVDSLEDLRPARTGPTGELGALLVDVDVEVRG